jgi:hypothetical protein
MSAEEFVLVKAYCVYWLDAPCWRDGGEPEVFRRMLLQVAGATNPRELREALRLADDFGLDPF